MVSGGARPRSGPAPDPTALRRDRKDDKATWITLPAERTGPAPEWPLAVPASPIEVLHWDRAWKTPQATQWEANGQEVEVALYVRSLAEAEIPGAATNLRTLVKQLQENLGLSYVGLLKFKWKVDGLAAPSTTTPAARPASAARRPSSRDRVVKAVPPLIEDDPAPF